MSLYLGDKQIASGSIAQVNIPHSLGESKYSPTELNNVSWLDASSGTYYLGSTYPSFYNEFSNKIGEDFASGKIKLHTDTTITDYDLIINNVDGTFRLPLLDGSEDLLSDKYEDLTMGGRNTPYTAKANGWFVFGKRANATGQFFNVTYNEPLECPFWSDVSSGGTTSILGHFVKVEAGQTITIDYSADGQVTVCRFIYAQGNGKLYFYIGETTQNANIIDFAQIREELNLKASKDLDRLTTTGHENLLSYSHSLDWNNLITVYQRTTATTGFTDTYECPDSGLFIAYAYTNGGTANKTVNVVFNKINNIALSGLFRNGLAGPENTKIQSQSISLAKGDTITYGVIATGGSSGSTILVCFIPYKKEFN